MKRFIVNVSIFGLMLIGQCFLIGHIKIPDSYVIHKTHNTSYEKIAWNLDQINNHPERIRDSVVFLGPSLVQAGICDATLASLGLKAINMGVNHIGNEVTLFFVNRIIDLKPKKIYLHLSKEKPLYLHPMTPLLYSPLSLLSSGQTFNVAFMNYLFKRAGFVLDFLVWRLLRPQAAIVAEGEYGIRYNTSQFSTLAYEGIGEQYVSTVVESPYFYLNGFKLKSEQNRTGISVEMKRFFRLLKFYAKNVNFLFNARSQQIFAEKAEAASQIGQVEIAELYVPILADAKARWDFTELSYAPRLTARVESVSNFAFLNQPEYWFNMTHLSKKGAIAFTRELFSQNLSKYK